jgi:hypothetical protein
MEKLELCSFLLEHPRNKNIERMNDTFFMIIDVKKIISNKGCVFT